MNDIAKQIDEVVGAMALVTVTNDAEYAFVAEWTKKCKATQKIVKEYYAPAIAERKAALDEVKAMQDVFMDRLEKAEKEAKRIMVTYYEMIQAEKRQEEARLRDEARKAEEERRLEKASRLAEQGRNEAADALLEQDIVIGTVQTQMETPKVGGLSFRENWSAKVVDFPALVKAVAEGRVAIDYLLPNQTALNIAAREYKKDFHISGVQAEVTTTSAVR